MNCAAKGLWSRGQSDEEAPKGCVRLDLVGRCCTFTSAGPERAAVFHSMCEVLCARLSNPRGTCRSCHRGGVALVSACCLTQGCGRPDAAYASNRCEVRSAKPFRY